MAKAANVEATMARLGEPQRALAERLRALIAAAAPDASEQVKWNAPSYCVHGEDRVTLNFGPRGDVRVILHRGARPREDGFAFADADGLAEWRAPDRGVVTLRDTAELDAHAKALTALIARWIAATA